MFLPDDSDVGVGSPQENSGSQKIPRKEPVPVEYTEMLYQDCIPALMWGRHRESKLPQLNAFFPRALFNQRGINSLF